MKKLFQITTEGKKELEVELDQLKARRGDIADKIAEARDYGDLSENAEYDAAREEQGLVESRIAEIEDILMNAELIKGVICGYRIEDIENPLTKQTRYLDKLVDELAKGKAMEKILRK